MTFPKWPSHRARILLRVIWVLAIIAVIVGSLLRPDSLPMEALDRLPISDKVQHCGAYALLAFLPAIHERRRVVFAAAVGSVLLGVILEYAQRMTGWRDFEVLDMVADGVGAGLGLAIGVVIRPRLYAAVRDMAKSATSE